MEGVYRPPLGRVCDFEEDDDEYQSNALQRKRDKDHHDEFFLGNYLTQTNQAIEEEDCRQEDTSHPDDPTLKAPIPTTNAGGFAYEVKDKNDTELFQVPCHVLLNQAVCCVFVIISASWAPAHSRTSFRVLLPRLRGCSIPSYICSG